MKRSHAGVLEAMEFESVQLSKSSLRKALFAVRGVPGIFRRVALPKPSERRADQLVAFYGHSEVCLVRADDVELELAQAGFQRAPVSPEQLPQGPRQEALDSLFRQAEVGAEVVEGIGTPNLNGQPAPTQKDLFVTDDGVNEGVA